MKRNIGTTDKIVRLAIALAAVTLYFADVLNGTVALLLLAVSVTTAFAGVCPLYRLFGIGSHKPAGNDK